MSCEELNDKTRFDQQPFHERKVGHASKLWRSRCISPWGLLLEAPPNPDKPRNCSQPVCVKLRLERKRDSAVTMRSMRCFARPAELMSPRVAESKLGSRNAQCRLHGSILMMVGNVRGSRLGRSVLSILGLVEC